MYIGNVMLIVLNLPLVGMWARIAIDPFPDPGADDRLLFRCSGPTASDSNPSSDVWVMLIFGGIGYFMRKLGFPYRPAGIGVGPRPGLLETSLQQALLISQGSALHFLYPPHLGRVHGARLPLHRAGDLGAGAGQGAGGGRGGCGLR